MDGIFRRKGGLNLDFTILVSHEMNVLGRANPILVSTWVLAEGADPLCFFFWERKESEISSDVSWGSGTYNTPSIYCFITVTCVYSHICIFDQFPATCYLGSNVRTIETLSRDQLEQ